MKSRAECLLKGGCPTTSSKTNQASKHERKRGTTAAESNALLQRCLNLHRHANKTNCLSISARLTMDGLIQKVVSPDLRGTETLIQTSNSTDLHRPVTAYARSLCTLSRPKDSPRGAHESSNKCNEFLGLERALPGVAGASLRSRAGMSVLNHLPASATRKYRLLVAKSEILRTHLGSRKQRPRQLENVL